MKGGNAVGLQLSKTANRMKMKSITLMWSSERKAGNCCENKEKGLEGENKREQERIKQGRQRVEYTKKGEKLVADRCRRQMKDACYKKAKAENQS